MDCTYHPGTAAVALCGACKHGVCSACGETKSAPDMGPLLNGVTTALRGARPGRTVLVYCRTGCPAYVRMREGSERLGKLFGCFVMAQIALVVVSAVGFVVVAIVREQLSR